MADHSVGVIPCVQSMNYGPKLPISEEVHSEKYRQPGESFSDAMNRIAKTLSDDPKHYVSLYDILANQRFMPAGRVQSAIGSAREVTAMNCYVSGTIEDDSEVIMQRVKEAFLTMRLGGGIGYDFSRLRPNGDLIKTLQSKSSGPLAFMNIFDATCGTVRSAGHRRGAQMGVLRVDHPDIFDFVRAKRNTTNLTNFNISVGITDEFMDAVQKKGKFMLRFENRPYMEIDAVTLWNEIMQSTWDWAEPGVLYVDAMNRLNNLYYCEQIDATNPCGEQPLPPYGACLLGSFNMVKYLTHDRGFDLAQLRKDIRHVVRAMDNIVDVTLYPLPAQKQDHHNKRRMGLGITGAANAFEAMGYTYGSSNYIRFQDIVLRTILYECYDTSADLAREKGAFPLFDADKYCAGEFIQRLPKELIDKIHKQGIRNSHLTSIAPTGTISLSADNISSGIEPVFSYGFDRTINMPDGVRTERVDDYGVRNFGVRGKTADQCSIDDHVNVLIAASYWVDSAVSKTCNVGPNVSFDDFKNVYMRAWEGGAKGCTTFRAAGKRMGILNAAPSENEGAACTYDPLTGQKTCG